MITEIGITAGEIWHFLDENGSANLDAIAEGTQKPKDLVMLSLGWLAREGHIQLENPSLGVYMASLSEVRK